MNPRALQTLAIVGLASSLVGTSGCGSSASQPSGPVGSAGYAGAAGGGGSSATGGGAASGGAASGGSSATGGSGTGGSGGTAGSGGAGTGGRGGTAGSGGASASGKWSMGYYAVWQANQYPVSAIDWSGLTHLAVAFYTPQADGSLQLGQSPSVAAALVQAAHAHGVLAIASIGGSDSEPYFQKATASGTLQAFVASLGALLSSPGYDGIDFDWEPLTTADEPTVVKLAQQLRAAHPGVILTIPIGAVNPNLSPDLSGYARLAGAFDQLNIMTYGMAGAWQGWKSWHSSALYQTDSATPLSVDSSVQAYLAANVPAAKLGIGIGFFGLCYSPPVTGPDQTLGGSTILAGDGTMSFQHIMGSYFSSSARKWDTLARVPYLSFSSAQGPQGCSYISYDDAQSIQEKGKYIKAKNLGGVIEWEINEGYLPSATAGQTSPLLDAVRDNVLH